MSKPEKLDVIFRADRKKEPEILAIFPSEPGTNEYDMTCYAHVGQHGSCPQTYIYRTRLAKPAEYADLLTELRQIYGPEYELVVKRKITPQHREARRQRMREMDAAAKQVRS